MADGLTMADAAERRGAHKQPPPPVDSLDLRQRARRDRIVQATVQLMGDHDYDSLQMKDITAAAGVALGTTYRYFSSKDHLVAEALLAWSEQFKRESDMPTGRSVDRLKIAFRRAARAFELYPCIYGHMLAVQASTDPLAMEMYARFAVRRRDAFSSFVTRVPEPRRDRVVAVMTAVLTAHLRSWTLGHETIEQVYGHLDSAAELLLD
jgi:TetR/AcrR family transcriptional regulator, cholesterol catabolism regulator